MQRQAGEQPGSLSMERDLQVIESKTRSKNHYAVANQEKIYQAVSAGLVYKIHAPYRTGRSTAGLLCSVLDTALQDWLKSVWNRTRKIKNSELLDLQGKTI